MHITQAYLIREERLDSASRFFATCFISGIKLWRNGNACKELFVGIRKRDWAFIAAGSNHSIALKTDGTLWAWGWNYYGQLGDGSTVNKYSPVKIGN